MKIVNGIAIASGVISLTVVGLGGYVFIRKDAIIDSVKGKVMEAVTEKLSYTKGGLGDLGGLGGGGLGLPAPSNPMAAPEPTAPESPIPLRFLRIKCLYII